MHAGYVVQKRERGGDWVKCNNFPTANTTFTAQDLREGNRYEFRVLAVNEAGTGKPSKPSHSVTAKEQKSELLYWFAFALFLFYNNVSFTLNRSTRSSRSTETRQNNKRQCGVILETAEVRWRCKDKRIRIRAKEKRRL